MSISGNEGALVTGFRAKRQKVYDDLFGAQALFIAGLIIMPALLFGSGTMSRVLLFFFFWFLVWLSGRKNRPLFTVLAAICIIAFNMIIPYGEVIYSIGQFRITKGALVTGIHRAATFSALAMLSRVTIRHDLKIPGRFGSLVAESLRLFSVLIGQKQRITRRNFIGDIDRMMTELSNDSGTAEEPGHTKAAGYVVMAVVVILSWLPAIVELIFSRR